MTTYLLGNVAVVRDEEARTVAMGAIARMVALLVSPSAPSAARRKEIHAVRGAGADSVMRLVGKWLVQAALPSEDSSAPPQVGQGG
jgi:hypothetical protein